MWPFNKSLKWESLTDEQRRHVVTKLGRAHFGLGYEAVKYPYSLQRRPSFRERGGEDSFLSAGKAARIINLHRDMMRNSPIRVAQDQQMRVNVVGACGGKLYASFPEGYGAAADEVMMYFNKVWFPHAEFTFRQNFNWILKTCLTSMATNGNLILVFDDGILTSRTGTGRIRGFEGDEIADIPDKMLKSLFGSRHEQRRGFVYNASGLFCGAFVSTKHRGAELFANDFLTLRVNPYDDETVPNWIVLGDMRRFNQGRAVSPLTAAITTLVDLHEISASEAQAAKLNAKIVGQILTDASAPTDLSTVGAFDDEAGSGAATETQEFSTRALTSIGAQFDQMPEGLKIDLLDTKRPNPNMPAYIDFLAGAVGGTLGLARVYSTLKAQTSYTAFRGEQVMTEPSFEEARQDLERHVCDWAARCVIQRAVKMGLITNELPENWQYMLAWNWPKMREVSERDAQTALSLKLKNGVTSLTRELGPGEVQKVIAEQAMEKKLFDAAGIVYPSETTVSGQVKESQDAAPADGSNDGGETGEDESYG